jgi:hypothetical protein
MLCSTAPPSQVSLSLRRVLGRKKGPYGNIRQEELRSPDSAFHTPPVLTLSVLVKMESFSGENLSQVLF